MKNIVICGAGFAGVQAALQLDRIFKRDKQVSITLIDRHDYHLFTPNLFEVATAEEEFTSQKELKKSITLPLADALSHTKVKVIKGEILSVDTLQKKVSVGNTHKDYDYLIMALGSTTDYFGIQGAQEFSMPLKNLADALRIRNAVEFAVQRHRYDTAKQTLKFVIAGGGYTGVELAGEMHGLLNIVAWKYGYPREKLELYIVEAMNKLIPGLDDRLSRDAYFRLRDLGVEIKLSAPITNVDASFLQFLSGEKMQHDVLVWTTGVKSVACSLLGNPSLDKKGRLVTNEWLQVQDHPEIFSVGDQACVMNERHPVPPTAQNAEHQAAYLGYALPHFLKNQKPQPYQPITHGFIVNIGGKWAILKIGSWYITGFWAYFIDKLAHVKYYWSCMSLWQAVKHVFSEVMIYSKND